MKKLLMAIIVMVFIEIALFIIIGNVIGVMNTLFVIFLTSVLGVYVVKKKGVHSVQQIRLHIREGVAPGPAIIDAFFIFLGGVLFIVPGFFTDVMGLFMIIPWTRNLFKPAIYMWLKQKMRMSHMIIVQR